MRTQTIPVEGSDLLVTVRIAEPERGFCLVVHGFGEHSGRYARMVDFLVGLGVSTATYDLRGHGRSPGRVGRATVARHVLDNLLVRDTLRTYMAERAGGVPEQPRFLLGHSMGGLIAAESAVRRPWDSDGLVLSSPALVVGAHTPAPVRAVAPLVAATLPFLPVSTLDPEDISRDPEYVADYARDPQVHHGPVPAAEGATMLADGARMTERCRSLSMPVLLLAGDADHITDVSGARRLAANAGVLHDPRPEVTYHEFPGGQHELFNDLCRDEAYAALGEWLERRLPSA